HRGIRITRRIRYRGNAEIFAPLPRPFVVLFCPCAADSAPVYRILDLLHDRIDGRVERANAKSSIVVVLSRWPLPPRILDIDAAFPRSEIAVGLVRQLGKRIAFCSARSQRRARF